MRFFLEFLRAFESFDFDRPVQFIGDTMVREGTLTRENSGFIRLVDTAEEEVVQVATEVPAGLRP